MAGLGSPDPGAILIIPVVLIVLIIATAFNSRTEITRQTMSDEPPEKINAFGTTYEVFFVWDFPGLESAVHVDGTVNDNDDRDRGWTVELALP